MNVTTSVWIDKVAPMKFPEYSGRDLWADVAIVGGGISGLTAALLLKQQGLTVAILEKSSVGAGESGYTTAHLTEVIDSGYQTLIGHFGEGGARKAAQSSRDAIGRIEAWVRQFQIDCGYRRVPGYKYSEDASEYELLCQERKAMCRAGVEAELCGDLPPEFRAKAAIKIPNQAEFQPYKYYVALSRRIAGDGSHIFENTRVVDVQDGRPCEVATEHGRLRCGNVLVLAHVPVNNRVFLHTKLINYRTYAIAARIPAENALHGLYWDTASPYHYIRSQTLAEEQGGGEVLVVGGADHKVGELEHTESCFEAIEAFTRERFGIDRFEWRWSGQIVEPADGLPYIGLNSFSEHVYVGTGYSGNGMTFGTFAGMLLSDLVLGRGNPYSELYDATRIKPVAAGYEAVDHNLDVARHYVSDWISSGEVESLDDIQPGGGKLVTVAGKKLAVCRDEQGKLHALSPICPHLGCQVHWNSAEKSWDCPCHGSRFDSTGEVVNGPAVADLKKVELEELLEEKARAVSHR